MHFSEKSKKVKRKAKNIIFKIIFSRFFIVVLLLLFEILLLYELFSRLTKNISIGTLIIYDLIASVIILNTQYENNSYKISWLIIINALPGAGVLLYILFFVQRFVSFGNKKLRAIVDKSKLYYTGNYGEIEKKLDTQEKKGILNYNYITAGFVPYNKSSIKYFNNGKEYFKDIIDELNNAKKYIFIEMFIINDGVIWNEILNILKEKAKSGVEIKIMFDGLNSISSFGIKYTEDLKKMGINAKLFSPLVPLVTSYQNNRDHRKLIIIDGKVGYTGGINIGDEYANIYHKYGVWKDSGIKIIGNAIEGLVIEFLQIWYVTEKKQDYEFKKYIDKVDFEEENGYLIPYTDYPNDPENVTEQIYKMMFNYSFDYIYVMTPYLILDDSMLDTIIRAKKRGVDVKIITPHIPDKKLIFIVTRANYKVLIKNGVEIYEYKEGFIHSKVLIQDDKRAVVGTANLDYRSLYLHYENGVYIYKNSEIKNIKNDFDYILKKCIKINTIKDIPLIQRLLGAFLKLFANQF